MKTGAPVSYKPGLLLRVMLAYVLVNKTAFYKALQGTKLSGRVVVAYFGALNNC